MHILAMYVNITHILYSYVLTSHAQFLLCMLHRHCGTDKMKNFL